jgi:hypothetical protein
MTVMAVLLVDFVVEATIMAGGLRHSFATRRGRARSRSSQCQPALGEQPLGIDP